MELARVRRLPWPELILLTCGLLLALGLMFRTSSDQCHQWKNRLDRVTGAFLAAAGEKEYPQGNRAKDDVARERESLRRAAKRVLDDRPFGCL